MPALNHITVRFLTISSSWTYLFWIFRKRIGKLNRIKLVLYVCQMTGTIWDMQNHLFEASLSVIFSFPGRKIETDTIAVAAWHLLSLCRRRSPKTTLSNAPHIVLTLKAALSPGCILKTNHRRSSWRTWWLTMFDPWCRDAFWSRRQRRRLSDWGRRWTTALSWDPRPQIPPIPPPT